jgi:hypothetical protein
MPDERPFDVEEFSEAIKQVVISSFRPGSGCCCSCSCSVPQPGHGGEIAELVIDEE